jgi:hypothetical protein
MKNYTLDNLYDQIERMRSADMPRADCVSSGYANALSMAAEELPKLSGKAYGLVMEMLFAAYQLGQNRMNVLREKDERAKAIQTHSV